MVFIFISHISNFFAIYPRCKQKIFSLFLKSNVPSILPSWWTVSKKNFAKEEHLSYPLWGQVARSYGIVPINRGNTKKALSSLRVVEEAILNKKTSFLIAPEGTRSKSGKLGVFKKGAFHIAKNTGVKIIPVIINGAYEAKSVGDWRLTPGIINIHFADIIDQELYKDMTVEELRDYTIDQYKIILD